LHPPPPVEDAGASSLPDDSGLASLPDAPEVRDPEGRHWNKTPLNGAPGQLKELTPKQAELIKSLNEYDVRLYEYAARLHDQSIERLNQLLRRKGGALSGKLHSLPNHFVEG
jgi:hypothetical protein